MSVNLTPASDLSTSFSLPKASTHDPKNDKVLIVDDDPNVLRALSRRLRRRFNVETALCSEEGETAVNILGPFAVVVSDMQMPRMNGAEFLEGIYENYPDSTRIMLTGDADQQTAIDAVNRGRVTCFLNKPVQSQDLEAAIQRGLEEYRERIQERNLCDESVQGMIHLISQILGPYSPAIVGRQGRLRHLLQSLAAFDERYASWEYDATACLAPLGEGRLPDELCLKHAGGDTLDANEQKVFRSQYTWVASTLRAIPRLADVARIIELQAYPTWENEGLLSEHVETGAGVLAVVIHFDDLVTRQEMPAAEALEHLLKIETYDKHALKALERFVRSTVHEKLIEVPLGALQPGMKLASDIVTDKGAVLITKGQVVTMEMCLNLENYSATRKIQQPIKVLVADKPTAEAAG